MGYMQAVGMAENTNLEVGLRWHFEYNHFPPPPQALIGELVEVAKLAIGACVDEDPKMMVTLPEGLKWRHRTEVTAETFVGGWHLEPWVETFSLYRDQEIDGKDVSDDDA